MPDKDKYKDDPWYEVADALPPFVGPVHLPYGSAEYIVKRLMNQGLTQTAATAMVGNLYAESKLDPKAKQKLAKGGEGKGRGIAQWETGGRWDNPKETNVVGYAKKRKVSPYNLDLQIDFITHEMRRPDTRLGKVKKDINKTQSLDEATDIILTKYERAGKGDLKRRIGYSKGYADHVATIDGFDPSLKFKEPPPPVEPQGPPVPKTWDQRVEEKLRLLNEHK